MPGMLMIERGTLKWRFRAGLRGLAATDSPDQYTQRTVPGKINVIGSATNAATVTVNRIFLSPCYCLSGSLVAPGNLLKEHPREFSPASLAALHEKHGVKKMGTKR